MKNAITAITTLLILLFAVPVLADPGDVLRELVPPPKLILRYQNQLQLTDEQKNQLKDIIKDAQSQSLDLEFKVQEEAEKLAALLAEDTVKEKAALAQAEKLMELEGKLKRVRLRLLIRTKNILDENQLAKIAKVRAERRDQRQERRQRRMRLE